MTYTDRNPSLDPRRWTSLRAWTRCIGLPVAAASFGLLWLAWPVADFATDGPSPGQIALVTAGLLAFAPLFLLVVMTRRPVLAPVVAMSAIAVALTLGASEGLGLMFIYVASAAGVRLKGRDGALAVTAVTALAAATLALGGPDAGLFWGITSAVLATGTLWFLVGGLLRTNAALREARRELAERAVADERLRFARDLHDGLGHDLSLIALKAELAGKLLPARVEEAATEVHEIKTLTRSALSQVRSAVDGYRVPTLPGELAGARVALETAGIDLRVDGPELSVAPEVETVLAWAVREGATNVLRHSGARHATITVRNGGATAELEIADDGRGTGAHGGSGHGLTGLRERAQSLGGTVATEAGPDGGFNLRVSLPATRTQATA